MILVLCDPSDLSAIWAGQGLRARGLAVEFAAPAEIIHAPRLSYRAGNGRPPEASAELASGRRIALCRLHGALNRANRQAFPQVSRAAVEDRAYVQAEMDAILLAWLGALPGRVLNPAHTSGWSGPQAHPFAWALWAQRAGFPTPARRCGYAGLELPSPSSQPDTAAEERGVVTEHLVLENQVFPALPEELSGAACRLAEISGVPLLGIRLLWNAEGGVKFLSATPQPDLRPGGAVFLDALASTFSRQP